VPINQVYITNAGVMRELGDLESTAQKTYETGCVGVKCSQKTDYENKLKTENNAGG
jgi:hypothetical protein